MFSSCAFRSRFSFPCCLFIWTIMNQTTKFTQYLLLWVLFTWHRHCLCVIGIIYFLYDLVPVMDSCHCSFWYPRKCIEWVKVPLLRAGAPVLHGGWGEQHILAFSNMGLKMSTTIQDELSCQVENSNSSWHDSWTYLPSDLESISNNLGDLEINSYHYHIVYVWCHASSTVWVGVV